MSKRDGCAEHYICARASFFLSMLPQARYVILECGVSTPGNGREVVDGLNDTDKRFLFQPISTVKLWVQTFMTHIW